MIYFSPPSKKLTIVRSEDYKSGYGVFDRSIINEKFQTKELQNSPPDLVEQICNICKQHKRVSVDLQVLKEDDKRDLISIIDNIVKINNYFLEK